MTKTLKILISGVPHGPDAAPYVRISFRGLARSAPVPPCLVPTSERYLLPDLRWSLEDFATKDPFNSTRANRTADNIKKYTALLIELVLDTLDSPSDFQNSPIIVQLSDRWRGSALLTSINDGANVVPLMQWECLEDLTLWPSHCRPEAVAVIRTTPCFHLNDHGTPTVPRPLIQEGKSTQILALSARPAGDSDVPHRLITKAIYHVVQSLASHPSRPEFSIARPGTIEGLEKTLHSYGASYFDILHIDVHGTATEDSEPRQVNHLLPNQLAAVLHKYDIRCVIMNACQSAAGINNFSRSLVQEGIPTVVGMQYKLLESAAEILSTHLYYGLLAQGRSLPDACSYARSKLRELSRRRTNYNTTVEVPDYLNPVLFTSEHFEESEFQTFEGRDPTIATATGTDADEGFFGRESMILSLENEFLINLSRQYLHGPAGSGKSALTRHISWWWKATGLVRDALRVDFATVKCEQWQDTINILCEQIPDAQVTTEALLIKKLQSHRHLIIFDSLDALSILSPSPFLECLFKFLKAFKKAKNPDTASLIIFIGREAIPRLRSMIGSEYELPRLDFSASLQLSFNTLKRLSKNLELTNIGAVGYMREIVKLADGNPMALQLIMADFAARTESPPEYYHRLTSWKQLRVDDVNFPELTEHRSVQQVFDICKSSWEWESFDTLPPQHLIYLSPFWHKIPAKLSSYWKFLEIAFRRVVERPIYSFNGLHNMKEAAHAMDPIEVQMFYERDFSTHDFDPNELEDLDTKLALALASLCQSGFLGFSTPLQLKQSPKAEYYWIHPLLTIALRTMLNEDTAHGFIIAPAYQRFYERRNLISWPTSGTFGHPDWTDAICQLHFEFENYATAMNYKHSIKLTNWNYRSECGDIIEGLQTRDANSIFIAHGLKDRGIEHYLEALPGMKTTWLWRSRQISALWSQWLMRKLTQGHRAPTDDIKDQSRSHFSIHGVGCLGFVLGGIFTSYELGIRVDKYREKLQKLDQIGATESVGASAFHKVLGYTKKVFNAIETNNEAKISEAIAAYKTALGSIGYVIGDGGVEIQKPSDGLEDYRQAWNITLDMTSKIRFDRELFPREIVEVKEAEEAICNTLVRALQRNASPAQIARLYGHLATLALIRSDMRLVTVYIKALEPYLSQLPVNEEPWLSFRKTFDLVQENGLLHQHFLYKVLEYQNLIGSEETHEDSELGRTLLSWAAEKGHANVVRQQIEAGADVESSIDDCRTPLWYAASNGHADIVKQLLDAGAKVELKDRYDNFTPLLWAARRGHSATVKNLLDAGAAVDSNNAGNLTPLMWAVGEGHSDVIDHLLKAGAAIDSKKAQGAMELLYATDLGHSVIVKQLLEAGADPNAKSIEGVTVLHKAAKEGNEDIIQHLLNAGAAIDSTNKWGETPLLWAAERKNPAIVKQLLEAGADSRVKSDEGVTALHAAARSGDEDSVKQLLAAGADVMSEDMTFRTPRWYADDLGYKAIAQLL